MDAAELLKSVTSLWQKQIVLCRKKKQKDFGETADLAWKFLGRKYDDIYVRTAEEIDGQVPFPEAPRGYKRPTLNLSQNFVALMLPYIHNKVPNRLVSPRRPQMPPELIALFGPQQSQPQTAEVMRTWLLQWWLNYLPQEYGLTTETRQAATEALVKGRGVVWHELVETANGDIPGSFYDTVDGLLIDADSKKFRDAGFIMRKRTRSAWKVADEFGLPADMLRKSYQSNWFQAEASTTRSEEDNRDEGGDVCVYYEVYSRMGFGHKLVGAPQEIKDVYDTLESAGQHIWLAIMPGVPFPLNLPPEKLSVIDAEEIKARMEWPIAFHQDYANPWPCTPLDFYPNCDNPWAKSPLEAGLPMQIFLDHVFKYVTNRIKATCRNIYVVSKALEQEFKDALASGVDQLIAEVDGKPGVDLDQFMHTVVMPELNKDLWAIIQLTQREFEKATGMDPLMYGSQPPTQDRSAEATKTREAHLTSRPDDFSDTMESWNSSISAKEAVASRLHVVPETIANLVGEPINPVDPAAIPPGMEAAAPELAYGPLTQAWMQLVSTDDPGMAASDLQYTVEAGTGRRKNQQKQAADATQITQILLQPFLQLAMQGNPEPYNNLMAILGEAYEMPMERLMLSAPPPQPGMEGQPAPGEEQPPAEEAEAPPTESENVPAGV